MKKVINLLPFILLLSVTVFSFVKPEISVSISVLGLAALCGYKYFLESKELPNYEKVFAERLEEINKSNKEAIARLESELGKVKFKELNKSVGTTQPKQTVSGW